MTDGLEAWGSLWDRKDQTAAIIDPSGVFALRSSRFAHEFENALTLSDWIQRLRCDDNCTRALLRGLEAARGGAARALTLRPPGAGSKSTVFQVIFSPLGASEDEQALVALCLEAAPDSEQSDSDPGHFDLSQLPLAMAFVDVKARISWSNESFAAILGLSTDAICGLAVTETPTDEFLRLRAPEKILLGRDLRGAGAKISHLLLQVFDAGVADELVVVAWPEDCQANCRRHHSDLEERFRGAFDNSPLGMALVALDGRFLLVNDQFSRIVGYSSVTLLSRTSLSLIAPEDLDAAHEMDALILSGQIRRYANERKLLCADGATRTVVWSLALAGGVEARPLYAILQIVDITELHREREERIELERQLRHSRRLESIGLLAGSIAHDSNNNLHVIGCLADEIEEGLDDVQQRATLPDALRQIQQCIARGRDFNEQLLTFAGNRPLKLTSISLQSTFRRLEAQVKLLAGRHVEVVIPPIAADIAISVDVPQFERVLMNLVTNARDAMPNGGRLEVRAEVADWSLRQIPVGMRTKVEPGRWVSIEVADSGHGIPETLLERIFEPFFSTKDMGKGTGLGLAMARGVIEQCGGFIEVTSGIGKGTCFRIALPAADPKADDLSEGDQQQRFPEGKRERILVVDDNPEVLELAQKALVKAGYDVHIAATGESALRFHCPSGPLQLLLTDVVMPKILGTRLALLMRSAYPDLRVIFMTGYANATHFAEGGNGPTHAILRKPFGRSELLQTVRQVLDGDLPTQSTANLVH